jgi:uncharacterized protein (TIGR02594 family)
MTYTKTTVLAVAALAVLCTPALARQKSAAAVAVEYGYRDDDRARGARQTVTVVQRVEHVRRHESRKAHRVARKPSPARVAVRSTVQTADGSLAQRARAYLGKTAGEIGVRHSLWCAAFMNKLLDGGTGSNYARSYLGYGHRVPGPQVGTIAVLSRGRSRSKGHVGVVTGVDGDGNPIIVSGNHGGRVGEAVYPKARVLAYVAR